ncbi:MAG: family 78 glycoside hydrolase catalytic domain, partial [Clostridiales bacterium]|nr:family 78 glycoside hydrolase catalytic domain [Clostridiales bacterium]
MVFFKAKWIIEKSFLNQPIINIKDREWIVQDNEGHSKELRNFHTLFRQKFSIKDKQSYLLTYSADDIAKIWINGHFIDVGPAPAYYFSYNYQQFDITKYLVEGENVFCAHLYYQGEINRVFPSGDFRTGLIAEIHNDKNETIMWTSEKTLCHKSLAYETNQDKLLGYRTQYIEYIKAKKYDYDWLLAEYNDKEWDNAYIREINDHKFTKQISKPLQIYHVLPETTKTISSKIKQFDFGCEYAGVPFFNIVGIEDDIIEIRCGEELDDKGRVRFDMRCNCKYLLTHQVSGATNEHSVFYDYMAFRYMEIILPNSTKITDVSLLARNYPLDEKSTYFNSNHEMLNKIWEICKNGVRTGTQEGYLDCPTREKGLYLGDMTITAQSHFYLTGDLTVWKRALLGFAQSTFYYKGINTTCYNHYIHPLVDYSFQFPLNLLYYYKHSGDKEFLLEMVPYCETMFDYFEKYEKDGLLVDVSKEGHLVDWPRHPFDFTDGYDCILDRGKTTGTHNLINAFHIGGRINMNEIYDILDISYDDRVPYLKNAYIKAFYDIKQKLFKDTITSNHCSLHSNVIPLFYGINPEDSNTSILQLIKEKRLHCGVYIAYFLLKGLCKLQQYKLVFDLITSNDLFSWSTMVKEGASTCFEVWSKEYKVNTSLCHPWASTPIIVLFEDLLGITPISPGWKDGYNETPHLPSDFTVSAKYLVN